MSALFAAAALAGGTTTAHAAVAAPTGQAAVLAPSNCSVERVGHRVIARCTGGSGEYRAYTRCDRLLAPDYNRYGAWTRTGSGRQSTASCDDNGLDRPFDYGVQVR